MYKLQLKAQAIEDMNEAFDWYEVQRPGLGKKFLDEIQKYTEVISQEPELFIRHGRQRIAFMRRFPFKIIFEVQAEIVVLYRVFHASRNPGRLSDPAD